MLTRIYNSHCWPVSLFNQYLSQINMLLIVKLLFLSRPITIIQKKKLKKNFFHFLPSHRKWRDGTSPRDTYPLDIYPSDTYPHGTLTCLVLSPTQNDTYPHNYKCVVVPRRGMKMTKYAQECCPHDKILKRQLTRIVLDINTSPQKDPGNKERPRKGIKRCHNQANKGPRLLYISVV